MVKTYLIHHYYSFSHWGLFRLPIIWVPYWHYFGDIDDELITD